MCSMAAHASDAIGWRFENISDSFAISPCPCLCCSRIHFESYFLAFHPQEILFQTWVLSLRIPCQPYNTQYTEDDLFTVSQAST